MQIVNKSKTQKPKHEATSAGSKPSIEHLNLSPNWMLPFWIASSIFLILITVLGAANSITNPTNELFEIVGVSILGCFFLTILTSMWVAFRGKNRRFHTLVWFRAAMVGMLVPGLLCLVYLILEYINYGAPTKSSPGLEVNLITAILAGEALVWLTSYPLQSEITT